MLEQIGRDAGNRPAGVNTLAVYGSYRGGVAGSPAMPPPGGGTPLELAWC